MDCTLPYIPERLHTKDREPIPEFFLQEHLYRRCSPAEKENPFANISLVDLSVNRSGKVSNSLCQLDDVLYNTAPSAESTEERLQGKVIVNLEILEIATGGTYEKVLVQGSNNCSIYLKHKPEACNYAHATFVFYSNDVEVQFDNWKQTLGSNAQKYLRTMCRQELAKMILREEIRINW